MFPNFHNINYRKIKKSYFLKGSLSITCFAFAIFSFSPTAQGQEFDLPDFDSLSNSVDEFYNNFCTAQISEFKESQKKRWLSYIPSPGYSPFTGGFTLSLNLTGPIQELNSRQLRKQKIEAIKKQCVIDAHELKNEVFADRKTLEISIQDYHSRDTLVNLKEKAFKIAKSQYQRNQLTPTDFITKQFELESLHVQRINEANLIFKQILLLLIKSKMPMRSNAPAFTKF